MIQGWINKALQRMGVGVQTVAPLTPEELAAELVAIDRKMMNKQLDDARFQLGSLLTSNPGEMETLVRLGIVDFLEGDMHGAVAMLEQVVAALPGHAQARKFLAAALFKIGGEAQAQIHCEAAFLLLPGDASVASMLGVLLMNSGQSERSAQYFHRALELDPTNFTPLRNLEALAQMFHRRGLGEDPPRTAALRKQTINSLLAKFRRGKLEMDDANTLLALTGNTRAHFATAQRLAEAYYAAPKLTDAFAINLATVYGHMGNRERALALTRKAYEINPESTASRSSLGNALIIDGGKEWQHGWQLMDEYFHKLHPAGAAQVPQWDGKKLGKNRLFVYEDQGVGDLLLALRLLRQLTQRGVKFVLWTRPAIADIARSACSEVLTGDVRPDPREHGCSAAVPLFGLVHLLKLAPADIKTPQYVSAPAQKMSVWRDRLSHLPGKRIGMVACGAPWRNDDWLRSVPPEELSPLTRVANVSWVNLAVDERPERDQIVRLFSMYDPAGEILDFSDTAGIIANLDLVIAIDCSVAHLAAALQKPVWLLKSTQLDFRWQIGADPQPWWPNVENFCADAPGEWKSAVVRAAQKLEIAMAKA